MFTTIGGADAFFDNKPFLKDEAAFNLLHLIRECPSSLLLTNHKSAVIGQSSPQYQAWIWTADDIDHQDIEELTEIFNNQYRNSKNLSFSAKPEIAERLAKSFSEYRKIGYHISIHMQAYHCPAVTAYKEVSGNMARPDQKNIDLLKDLHANFIKDCFGEEPPKDELEQKAERLLNNPDFYIWRCGEEIVSMAEIVHRSARHARINEVYTRSDKRNRGYAGALTKALCRMILNEGRIPMLYTDLSNPASNKCYQNIGFIECGKVDTVVFDFK